MTGNGGLKNYLTLISLKLTQDPCRKQTNLTFFYVTNNFSSRVTELDEITFGINILTFELRIQAFFAIEVSLLDYFTILISQNDNFVDL